MVGIAFYKGFVKCLIDCGNHLTDEPRLSKLKNNERLSEREKFFRATFQIFSSYAKTKQNKDSKQTENDNNDNCDDLPD